MKKIGLITTLCILMAFVAGAQETYTSSGGQRNLVPKKKAAPKGFDPQKLVFGGGLGLSFGAVTDFSFSPIVGYRFTDRFTAGVGVSYEYLKIKDYLEVQDLNQNIVPFDYKTSILAPSVFARYRIFDNVFVHASFEEDFQKFNNYRLDPNGSGSIDIYTEKYQSPALLLGLGLRQPVTENSSLVILALYDVIQDQYSPYYGRIEVRFGYNIGF